MRKLVTKWVIMQTKYEILKSVFGYDAFRGGQEQLIDSILSGRDTLGVMPTGAGKSIIYQIPALMFGGVTIIVSPLISLMKDQVNALIQAGVKAAYINSSLTERQISIALDRALRGAYKLIYVAPERLLTKSFVDLARQINISMLTVDEAHCISQWGQDFRPSYARIPEFIELLDERPIISAFTATATPVVREDIVSLLKLQNQTELVSGFDRPNLCFRVEQPKDKFAALLEFLRGRQEQSGIVYCATRAAVEEVCDKLKTRGFSASRYHAGLEDKERHDNQDDFLYDRALIMVATNAFGMGIDKSNVSFIVHYNMPKDIESYYQEAGRAGRDGRVADCLLLYSGQDVRLNAWMIDNSNDVTYPDEETKKQLKARDHMRLKRMTFYATTRDCLRGFILKYFGETPPMTCGNCGNCNTEFEVVNVTNDARQISECVTELGERFGMNMVIDVLRGSLSDKVLNMGFDNLGSYGKSKRSERQLREIIMHMIHLNYLSRVGQEYPTIQLGESAKLLYADNARLEMRLSEDRRESLMRRDTDVQSLSGKTGKVTTNIDKGLFEILRKLRLDIAKEQHVPPFVVFADSSLMDMCVKMPTSMDDFLDVSGVGLVKLEKFGEQFIAAIKEYLKQPPETDREQLHMDFSSVEVSPEPVSISTIADKLNVVLLFKGQKKVSGQKLNSWLTENGYLHIEQNTQGKSFRVPTQKGEDLGILCETREIRGEDCLVNMYPENVQRAINEMLARALENGEI